MAKIVDESFEGAGYEEPWTETIDSGCTLDEDNADITPPSGGGSQILKAVVLDATNNQAYALQTKTDQSISYIRDYIYVKTESLLNGEDAPLSVLLDSLNQIVAQIVFGQDVSGNIGLRFQYYSGGAPQNTARIPVSLGTWYCVEYKYDITNMLWEWKIDGTTKHDGSLSSTTRTPQKIVTGIRNANNGCTVYHDLVAWDDADWCGAASTELYKELFDTLSVTDAIEILTELIQGEDIVISDEITASLIQMKELEDSLTITDVLNFISGKEFTEGISLLDVVGVIAQLVKEETMTISDAINFLASIAKAEDITLTDVIAQLVSTTKSAEMTLTDILAPYAFKMNQPLPSYKPKLLVELILDSGTKRIASDDLYIEE